jgi:hypothetical protein
MKKIAVVHYLGATLRNRSVVASVLADLRDEGADLHLLDISAFTTISQDFPPPLLARLLGHTVFVHKFTQVLAELGVTHHHLRPPTSLRHRLTPSQKGECFEAIESEVLTYFRRDTLDPPTPAIAGLRNQLTHQAFSSFDALSTALDEIEPDLVLIPNGRTSRQKAARLATEQRGIALKFYEDGRARKDSYYLGNTQPHDRLASQREVDGFLSKVAKKDIEDLATSWITERMNTGSGTNVFSASWRPTGASDDVLGGRSAASHAVFFTSSADEFLAFGPMWRIDSWENQFQAFDLSMSILESLGVALTLRVHPNLTGKSRQYFLQTVKSVKSLKARHPTLTVLWHNSPTNSYDLIAKATYIIAERSTIGLEANMRGKPVWINQASQWDQIADVRQMLEPSDVTVEAFTPWKVDITGAQRFVAYWMLQEKPLRYSWRSWATWNPEKAPLRMRVALLAVSHSWRHRWHLLGIEWSRWRNIRFRL